MYRSLEDEFGDVVGKARRGQQIAADVLYPQVGIAQADGERIERYEWIPDGETMDRLADALELSPPKLRECAQVNFFPRAPGGIPRDGVHVEMMVLGQSFLMNGYLVGCPATGRALCVDPGFDGDKIIARAKQAGLRIEQVFLTHGHHDHIGALKEIVEATQARVQISEGDSSMLGELSTLVQDRVAHGDTVQVGELTFAVRATGGHTPGGMSLVGHGMALVGDALFAGSLGGTRKRENYIAQRRAVEEYILSLDEAVVLYPGHGPATTVGEERAHNPFFL